MRSHTPESLQRLKVFAQQEATHDYTETPASCNNGNTTSWTFQTADESAASAPKVVGSEDAKGVVETTTTGEQNIRLVTEPLGSQSVRKTLLNHNGKRGRVDS